jgi:hypothetical protein
MEIETMIGETMCNREKDPISHFWENSGIPGLVMTDIAIENDHLQWIFP